MYGGDEKDNVARNCETFREQVFQFLMQRYLEKEELAKKSLQASGRRKQKGATGIKKEDGNSMAELGGETHPGELAEFIDVSVIMSFP